jgi:glycosyltransferase involved in cell wall biosynthesis
LAFHLGIPRERLAVVPEGGDHMLRIEADASILRRHGLERGRYAVAVGGRARHKNLGALQQAGAILASRGIRLVVVGTLDPGVFQGRPEAVGDLVPLGRSSDGELRALYENALCLVFASSYEGFGLPPLEAMVCGCPVVAARAGAVPEVCGEAALWFGSSDPEDLTSALHRLLDEPGLADALRQAGRSRAQLYTWRRAAEAFLEVIEQAMARPDREVGR